MFNIQAPYALVMVRPWHFRSNPETADDNAFQQRDDGADIADKARAEFDGMVRQLEQAGVRLHIFDDTGKDTPDSVFPNNWFSTHYGGYIALYPMYSPNRRRERRQDIIDVLQREYRVQEVVDYSSFEQGNRFLEGTGAIVFDHLERVAYAANSNRCHADVLERFCSRFHYEPFTFDAVDANGTPVYHTNVIMCIGAEYALVASSMVKNETRRAELHARLLATGRNVIELSEAQIKAFAGNALELRAAEGNILAMSQRAYHALTTEQIAIIEASANILSFSIPTIELAGGSVRCMMAGVHLSPRLNPTSGIQ